MTLTIELSDTLARHVAAVAAQQGQTVEEYVEAAVKSVLESSDTVLHEGETRAGSPAKPWMHLVGAAKGLSRELAELDAAVEAAFEQVEEEDLR